MAREIPIEEYLEKQLLNGRKVISNDQASRSRFAELKSECPDVDEDTIVRAFVVPGFGTKNENSAIYATIRLRQYNAQHPSPPAKDIFDQYLPEAVAKQVREDAEFREQFAALLSEIEEDFELEGKTLVDEELRKELAEAIS